MLRGDEFQGLLGLEQDPFPIIDFLEYRLFPFRFRAGMGVGEITVELSQTTHSMRGMAFELARTALHRAKRENRLYAMDCAPPKKAYDALLTLLSFIKMGWKNQMVFRRYHLSRRHGTMDKVAELEGVSKQAIRKTSHAYGFRQVIRATQVLHLSIKEEMGGLP